MAARLTLNVRELAAELGISLPLAYELTHRADFPTLRVGKRVVIPRAALEDWLMRQSGGAAAAAK